MLRSCGLAMAAALALGACATVPSGPGVMVLPGAGKNFDQFQLDDAICRQWAAQQTGITTGQASRESAVGSAVVGTVVGAAVGAAVGTGARDSGSIPVRISRSRSASRSKRAGRPNSSKKFCCIGSAMIDFTVVPQQKGGARPLVCLATPAIRR